MLLVPRVKRGGLYSSRMLPFIFVLATAAVSLGMALSPTGQYTQGPISLDETGTLWHRVDLTTRTAYLAILVNDSAALATDSASWVGIGFSEPTSGGMLGADVVTAEFTSTDTDKCQVTDRYVPFVSYPLLENPGAFPVPDDCQNDSSWVLFNCERDFSSGEMLLEVERSLEAHDTQDRDIVDGLNSVIFAYGSNFGYHGGSRASTQIILYEDGVDPDVSIEAVVPLPDDVDGFFDVLATNYLVPSDKETIYACTSRLFELESGKDRMIVAADHIIDSPINMVHHLTVFICSEKTYADKIRDTIECTTASNNGINGPLGNPDSGCSTFIYAYAKGMGRFLVPREAGYRVQKGRNYVIVETHYDNPEDVVGNIDRSGVRLYYTDTMRDNDAGSLLLGDSTVSRFGDTVISDFEYEHTCPGECTKRFTTKVNIFGSFLHMHTTGREIYTNKFSENGTFVGTMNKVNFWSDSFQKYVFFDPPLSLSPGEQLQTTCVYDTAKRPKTVFGLETKDEMCMDFIGYWPLQRSNASNEEINICSFAREGNTTFTLCGDNAILADSSIIMQPNPSLIDTVGAPSTFGDSPDSCSIPTPSSVQPTSSAAPPADATDSIETPPGNAATSPSRSPDEDDENTCFPASATVTLKNGTKKRMDEVAIGDEIQVGLDEFSSVFLFTHQNAKVRHRFLELQTGLGSGVTVTSGHYIYINGVLDTAEAAKVGDALTLADGKTALIESVKWKVTRGLFNPQTIHGDIVVDGVLCSTFTRSVAPVTAQGMLAPLRFLYRVIGAHASSMVCSERLPTRAILD